MSKKTFQYWKGHRHHEHVGGECQRFGGHSPLEEDTAVSSLPQRGSSKSERRYESDLFRENV